MFKVTARAGECKKEREGGVCNQYRLDYIRHVCVKEKEREPGEEDERDLTLEDRVELRGFRGEGGSAQLQLLKSN